MIKITDIPEELFLNWIITTTFTNFTETTTRSRDYERILDSTTREQRISKTEIL